MRLKHLLKITHQLGFTQVSLFALYKLGLKSGYYKRIPTPDSKITNIEYLFPLPSSDDLKEILGSDGIKTLLTEANHIVEGKFRIFGSELSDIKLDFNHPLSHWTDYELGIVGVQHAAPLQSLQDIKLIWESARFGWAFTLGRAYRISGDEKYAKAFWEHFESFDVGNPANMGPHWMNGQEVAIRLMAFVWAAQIFGGSNESTKQRKARLAQSVAEHATRIPSTILYARAQNNNHLPSEAAGLYTAALALPDHPQSEKWLKLGIKWLNWSFENQIDEKGEYIQHSVNYHRLMLQLALWVNALNTKDTKKHKGETQKQKKLRETLCPSCLNKIALATRWLAELTDSISGNAPNLGANDGAYIFPLANGDFRDFRSVVNATSRIFLNEEPFPVNEMSLWFNSCKLSALSLSKGADLQLATCNLPTLKPSNSTWAYLRVADGNLRLAHADQLHLDLWWQGENIALDSGTYLYNAEKPWDNSLSAAEFHNTVTVNGQDQMTGASKFMYLDWSSGRVVEQSENRMVAEHNGYRNLGVTHRREVSFAENIWQVEDNLQTQSPEPVEGFKPSNLQTFTYRLHWLLPDWEYELVNKDESVEFGLKSPYGLIKITQYAIRNTQSNFSLVRAGELLYGTTKISPTRGWYSPTYGVKTPALSLALEITASDDVKFISTFEFPAS